MIIVKANDKRGARLETIRYVLSLFDYEGKQNAKLTTIPDPDIVGRFHRGALRLD